MTETEDQLSRATVLQGIVDRLTADHAGSTPQEIRPILETAMRDAGLELGAEKWLGDASVEIAAGRVLVVDSRQDRRPPDPE